MNFAILGYHFREAKKGNERAKLTTFSCSNFSQCPIRKKGQCIRNGIFYDFCPYGKIKMIESSSTKRGKAYYHFVKEIKAKFESGEYQNPPEMCTSPGIYEIGDYFYLPYSHMCNNSLNEKVKFLQRSHLFQKGKPFIHKKDFTPKIICEIIKFKPHAMMGGEITCYQKEEIPKFIFHLQYLFPEIFEKVKQIMPEIREMVEFPFDEDKILKAKLSDIPIGTTYENYHLYNKAKVKSWDGTKLVILINAKELSCTNDKYWGCNSQDLEITFKPIPEQTDVYITDNKLKLEACLNNPHLIK